MYVVGFGCKCRAWVCLNFLKIFGGSLEDHIPIPMFQYASDTRISREMKSRSNIGNDFMLSSARVIFFVMSEAETETNPIDRAVAHLLFHRPLELSGKHTETPESPASVKFPFEHKSAGLMSLPMGCVSDKSQVKQNLSHQVSKVPSPLMDSQPVEQFKNSPCIDTSENASTYGPADGAPEEVEASQ